MAYVTSVFKEQGVLSFCKLYPVAYTDTSLCKVVLWVISLLVSPNLRRWPTFDCDYTPTPKPSLLTPQSSLKHTHPFYVLLQRLPNFPHGFCCSIQLKINTRWERMNQTTPQPPANSSPSFSLFPFVTCTLWCIVNSVSSCFCSHPLSSLLLIQDFYSSTHSFCTVPSLLIVPNITFTHCSLILFIYLFLISL